MLTRICATTISAALLQAFAFSANAEELQKTGLPTSGVRLDYQATVLPDGKLQIEFVLECKQSRLEPIYGAGAFAVINKTKAPADIQRNTLTCTSKGDLDKIPVSGKETGKMIMSGVSPADIGTKLVVVGRVEKGKSSRTDTIMKKAEEALDKEIAKAG